MKPKRSAKATPQGDLFRARLDQILDHGHPLYRLAGQIHWSVFEESLGSFYVEAIRRPGLPGRVFWASMPDRHGRQGFQHPPTYSEHGRPG